MSGHVLCHNEFTIVGRLTDEINNVDNKIRVLILCPNDDDYEELANRVYVNFDSSDRIIFENMLGHAIAVTGHIEYDDKLVLISDMYKFIN